MRVPALPLQFPFLQHLPGVVVGRQPLQPARHGAIGQVTQRIIGIGGDGVVPVGFADDPVEPVVGKAGGRPIGDNAARGGIVLCGNKVPGEIKLVQGEFIHPARRTGNGQNRVPVVVRPGGVADGGGS